MYLVLRIKKLDLRNESDLRCLVNKARCHYWIGAESLELKGLWESPQRILKGLVECDISFVIYLLSCYFAFLLVPCYRQPQPSTTISW